MNSTGIEWCDFTWNPITGCPGPKVSPGCAHCYAERMANTRLRGRAGYKAVAPFDIDTHENRWLQPLKLKKPKRIFVCSMGDLFHERVSFRLVAKVFAMAALCPQHTFMILTKRPERMREFITDTSTAANDRRGGMFQVLAKEAGLDPCMDGLSWPLPNVWLGVTCCNQAEPRAGEGFRLVVGSATVPGGQRLHADPLRFGHGTAVQAAALAFGAPVRPRRGEAFRVSRPPAQECGHHL